ncbi:uncharacterized protein [Typha latifolia]|uniref:uncharacterized protein n=1 Tax=Typha latifolia TaxID=4733 RepID=UPI003C30BBC4
MAANSRSRSDGFRRSMSVATAFASSSASAFGPSSSAARSAGLFRCHGSSPTPPSTSVRFAIDSRPTSPGRSFAVSDRHRHQPVKKPVAGAARGGGNRKTCTCSPTTHPGSFRCSLHKGSASGGGGVSSRLNARRSAMTNSLVRIGTVEGEWLRRALAALIRPSCHQQRRRAAFHPRPSRLSAMSKAEDDH